MKKFFVLGLIAVALSAGLLLTSCSKCPGDGKCEVSVSAVMSGSVKYCENAYKGKGTKNNCFGTAANMTKDGAKCKC